jgi:hypothetical protein
MVGCLASEEKVLSTMGLKGQVILLVHARIQQI